MAESLTSITDGGIETVADKQGMVLCHIIRADHSPAATTFYTPSTYSQQLGIIKYPAGGVIKAHYHNKVPREVLITQEVLVIRKGHVRVNLYDRALQPLGSVELHTGDTILLAAGGHGIDILSDTEMLEVKQGPYGGVQNDKTLF